MCNNSPSNAIVNAASNISYQPLLDTADTIRCDRPMCLTNIVIGKLRKLVHKKKYSHDLLYIYITSLLYKVDTLLLKHSYSCEGHDATYLSYTRVRMREKKPAISNMSRFFCFNITVFYTYKQPFCLSNNIMGPGRENMSNFFHIYHAYTNQEIRTVSQGICIDRCERSYHWNTHLMFNTW